VIANSTSKIDGDRKMKGQKTGGRQSGTRNKLTGDVKEIIVEALQKAGGVEYLAEQADKNPVAFMTLVGKVLPLAVASEARSEPMPPATMLSREQLMAIASQGIK
jgi:hypothetical protein